jgi:hypothetical protein
LIGVIGAPMVRPLNHPADASVGAVCAPNSETTVFGPRIS